MQETCGTLLRRLERLQQSSKPGSHPPQDIGALEQAQHTSSITQVQLQPSSEDLYDTIEPLTLPVLPSKQDTTVPENMLRPVETCAPLPPLRMSLNTQ